MAVVRWKQEREEVIELVYRVQANHGGNLVERDARKFGLWAPEAIKRAKKIQWFVAKGSPPMLSVTKKGSKAFDAAQPKESKPCIATREGRKRRT